MADNDLKKNNFIAAPVSSFDSDGQVVEVYQKYDKGLRLFLLRKIGSAQEIDDIMQEVYLRLIRYGRRNIFEPNFSFLCTVALNVLRSQLRKQKVRAVASHDSIDEAKIEAATLSPEQFLKSAQGLEVIKSAIAALDDSKQQAFVMHRFEGLTYEAIGKELGISISAVRKRIVNAMHQVTKKIKKSHEKNY
ncbi:MAG: RNA polymerase sigma factor [Desulfatitalea sp.]|nr:RNA polymerase sigma factor [Desulfatitalea sp.]NNJ99649.1 RNA polymerase sigma factor [Desulfatitalea sp.]